MDSAVQISRPKELAISLMKGELVKVTPTQAWFDGYNIQAALKDNPSVVRGWLVREVAELCKMVDAKKTLASDAEIAFCCRSIIEEHPTLKIEEIHVCFTMVKKGQLIKIYERLKTPEILDALKAYEAEVRAAEIEKHFAGKAREFYGFAEKKREPLNLAQLVEDSPMPKGQGLGTRLRQKNGWNKEENS